MRREYGRTRSYPKNEAPGVFSAAACLQISSNANGYMLFRHPPPFGMLPEADVCFARERLITPRGPKILRSIFAISKEKKSARLREERAVDGENSYRRRLAPQVYEKPIRCANLPTKAHG